MRTVFDTGALIAVERRQRTALEVLLVTAAASIQGDVVYTTDLDDFLRLNAVFPTVVVQRI